MHAREPWQSRSPTGQGVMKPAVSSTLRTWGHAPRLQNGRGLPVKRKALVILTVAILAFAMIPAIGTQAATGDVKIVTPAELANPVKATGESDFDALDEVQFASTQSGEEAHLGDSTSTLYIVIEDDDKDSNPLEPVEASFTVSEMLQTTLATSNLSRVFLCVVAAEDAMNRVVADANTCSGSGPQIADRDLPDGLDQSDVDIVVNEVEGSLTTVLTHLTHEYIGVSVSALTGGPDTIDVTYSTSKHDTLLDENGDSLVEVISDTGTTIRVIADEKDPGEFAASTALGIGSGDFEAEESLDSGVFMARFGLIEQEWKAMLTEWVENDGGVRQTTDSDTVTTHVVAAGDDPGEDQAFEFDLGGTGALAVNTERKLFDASTDGAVNRPDVNVTYTNASGSNAVESSWSLTENKTTGVVTIRVETDGLSMVGDTIDVGYRTTPTVSALKTEIGARETNPQGSADPGNPSPNVPLDNAFDDLCASNTPPCQEALDLVAALDDAARNLGINDADGASFLINRLLGVGDGDDIRVRYDDATSGVGIQTARTVVDSVAPTISDFDPADDSFTTDDRFTATFTVTDTGSGILEDAEEKELARAGNVKYIATTLSAGTLSGLNQDDDVADGFLYEVDVDVRTEADAARDAVENLTVTFGVEAYDIALNKATANVTFTVDVIDPELLFAITGWGAEFDSSVDRSKAGDKQGAYVLVEDQRDRIALVFNGPVNGERIRTSDIVVTGHTVVGVTWLNNQDANVVAVGSADVSGTDGDLDFDKGTRNTNQAEDIITNSTSSGLGLSTNAIKQDARHILFLHLDTDLDTDATPRVEIDGDDLSDLAGNENQSDHQRNAADHLLPRFTVTVEESLSNESLDVIIEASEELQRAPTGEIQSTDGSTERTLDVNTEGSEQWSVNEDLDSLNLSSTTGVYDGVWNVVISGTDDADNDASAAVAKWELDTQANDGEAPTRGGAVDGKVSLETNDVIFLSLSFDDEADEYTDGGVGGTDSEKSIALTEIVLENLDSDGNVTGSTELDTNVAQSSDGVRHVIALADAPIGDHRLQIDYEDVAGNSPSDPFAFAFSVTAPQPVSIDVSPGWTLISVPGRPQDISIGSVLGNSTVSEVWSLNNETKIWQYAQKDSAGAWTGTLTQIVDGRAYFVRSSTFDPISVLLERFSPRRTPPQYAVTPGWNSIGYTPAGDETHVPVDGYLSSLGTSGWGMIRMWNADATPPQYETYYSSGVMTDGFPDDEHGVAVVQAGNGYLLFATRSGAIGG